MPSVRAQWTPCKSVLEKRKTLTRNSLSIQFNAHVRNWALTRIDSVFASKALKKARFSGKNIFWGRHLMQNKLLWNSMSKKLVTSLVVEISSKNSQQKSSWKKVKKEREKKKDANSRNTNTYHLLEQQKEESSGEACWTPWKTIPKKRKSLTANWFSQLWIQRSWVFLNYFLFEKLCWKFRL